MNKALALILISFLFCACNELSDIKSADELQAFVNDPENGLSQVHEQGKLKFTLSYYPKQLIIDNQMQAGFDSAKFAKLKATYNDFEYFKLAISYNAKSYLHQLPKNQYSEYVNVFSFRMQNYVHLKAGENKVQPIDYQFEQLYGLSSADNFLFVFAKKDLALQNEENIKIIIDDFGLSTGKQVFEFSTSKIAAINQVALQQINTTK